MIGFTAKTRPLAKASACPIAAALRFPLNTIRAPFVITFERETKLRSFTDQVECTARLREKELNKKESLVERMAKLPAIANCVMLFPVFKQS